MKKKGAGPRHSMTVPTKVMWARGGLSDGIETVYGRGGGHDRGGVGDVGGFLCLAAAPLDTPSADIATNRLSAKSSGKQPVRIAVADADFRTDAWLADKGRFDGQGPVPATSAWGQQRGREQNGRFQLAPQEYRTFA